jgi:RES domain-containing protein
LDLDLRLARLLGRATALRGTFYRSAAPKYATSSDLVSGAGSRQHGGRWNPVGVAAVYGSLSPETALAETLAHSRYYSLPVHVTMPRTFVAIEFTLGAVLDLTVGRNRQALAVSQKRLLECDWRAERQRGAIPITQRIGGAAVDADFEAMLVPSAADPLGKNLVVFVDQLRAASCLVVVGSDRL